MRYLGEIWAKGPNFYLPFPFPPRHWQNLIFSAQKSLARYLTLRNLRFVPCPKFRALITAGLGLVLKNQLNSSLKIRSGFVNSSPFRQPSSGAFLCQGISRRYFVMGNNQLIMDNFSSAKVSSSICCVLVSEQDIPIFFLLSPRRWREGIGDSASQGMGKAVIPEKNKNLKKKRGARLFL